MSPPKLKLSEGESRLFKKFIVDVLDRVRPTSRRAVVLLGVKPLHALNHAYPELNAAVVFLDLRTRLARAFPAIDANREAARAARADVERTLNAMSDQHYSGAARWLRETVGDVPAAKSKKGLLEAVRKQLDEHYPLVEAVAASPSSKVAATIKPNKPALPKVPVTGTTPKTAFDVLDDLANQQGQVGHALRTFQQACLHQDEQVIRQTAQTLQDTITKYGEKRGLDWKMRDRCRRAVETVARSFERQLPTAEGLEAVLRFWQAFDRLKPTHPLVSVYERLQSWLGPDDFEKLGTAIARLRPMTARGTTKAARAALEDAVEGRVSFLVGQAGEIVGRKGAYRRTFEDQLRRAAAFAESSAGRGFRVYVARTPVRALRADGKGFHQFYDDAIMLIDEARGKVALSFTGQFKAGDAASLAVLSQMDSDEAREMLKKLLVDGKSYEITKGIIPRESAIVTTILGVTEDQTFVKGGARRVRGVQATTDPRKVAAALKDREINFIPMGVDPADLRSLIRFFLEAAGKIPPS